MQRTLVGLTGDDRSAEALCAAHDVSRRLGAELTYVHACERTVRLSGWGPPGARDAALDAPLACLRSQFVGRIRAAIADATRLEDRVLVQAGSAAEVLTGCARVRSAELLFLGRQRRRGTAELGATQRRLLADPPCALWFQDSAYVPPRQVSLAASGGAERDALPLASRIAGKLGARFGRRIGFEGEVHAEELLVLPGGPRVAAQAAELTRRGVALLVVPAIERDAELDREPTDADELESPTAMVFVDPDVGIQFDLG